MKFNFSTVTLKKSEQHNKRSSFLLCLALVSDFVNVCARDGGTEMHALLVFYICIASPDKSLWKEGLCYLQCSGRQ